MRKWIFGGVVWLGCGSDESVVSGGEAGGSGTSVDASGTSAPGPGSMSDTGADPDTGVAVDTSAGESSSGGEMPGAATMWETFLAREGNWVSTCDVAFAPDGSFALSAAVEPIVPGPPLSGFVAWFAPDGTQLHEYVMPDSILYGIDIDASGRLWGIGSGQNPHSDVHGPHDDETTWGTWLRLDEDGTVMWEIIDPERSTFTDSCGIPMVDLRGTIHVQGDGATIYRYNDMLDDYGFHQEVLRIDGDGVVQATTRFRRNPPFPGRGVAWIGDATFVVGDVETGLDGREHVVSWMSRVDADGTVAWERDIDSRETWSVAAGDGALYWIVQEYTLVVEDQTTTILRIDPNTGDTLWMSELPRDPFQPSDVIVRDQDLWAAVVQFDHDPGANTMPALRRHAADGSAIETLRLATEATHVLPRMIFAGPGEDVILAGLSYADPWQDAEIWLARAKISE